MAKWIDIQYGETAAVGAIGYLVETFDTSRGGDGRLSLRERPLRTNQSHEPRLSGWCGETNNKSKNARGVWKIVRMNKAGERAQIVELTGPELTAFLEADGYPELAEVAT